MQLTREHRDGEGSEIREDEHGKDGLHGGGVVTRVESVFAAGHTHFRVAGLWSAGVAFVMPKSNDEAGRGSRSRRGP